MPSHHEARDVKFTAGELFELVADVESYHEFVPWCTAVRVRSRTSSGQEEVVVADMVVSIRAYSEKLVSHVTLDRENLRINVRYLDGPLRKMDCEWRFRPLGQGGCRVEYDVEFEFRNRLMTAFSRLFLDRAVSSIVSAFEKRAAAVLG